MAAEDRAIQALQKGAARVRREQAEAAALGAMSPEERPDAADPDDIPPELIALSVALDTGDAATTAEAAAALQEVEQ